MNQVHRFLKYTKEKSKHHIFYCIALFTGMHRSEIYGLKWKDIDFEKNQIHVKRQIIYERGKGFFEGPSKTESSKRIIKISDMLISELRRYQALQTKKMIRLEAIQPTPLLFMNTKRGYTNGASISFPP
ncbi:site-specific integrase [Peribacillus loiseleuriae]|uniref:site-specific integrase n=1 Tax=Peribacillus loiseleuriae TaxID=1679170 RepID=UPI003CFF8175